MEQRLDELSEKLDRVLAILDAKIAKKNADRERIRLKREEDAAKVAEKTGAIVVESMAGTFETDRRLPYKRWAFVCLEFQNPLNFLRWMVNEYLGSYHCLRDGRKRMIARNGNYWKVYKSCGTEMLITPADMFGGATGSWESTLDVQMLRWCYKHVGPVLGHLVNTDRLEFVHEKRLPWDDEKVSEECGPPLPLESRWWRKGARFRETLLACIAPYGRGYLRTTKGSLLIDFEQNVLETPEEKTLFKNINNALREGVMNRATHEEWVTRRRLRGHVQRGNDVWKENKKKEAASKFMDKLKQHSAVRLGMHLKEQHDLQAAIEQSIKEI